MGLVSDLTAKFNDINTTIAKSNANVEARRDKARASMAIPLNTKKLGANAVASSNSPNRLRIWETANHDNRTREPPETLAADAKYRKVVELDALVFWAAEYFLAQWGASARAGIVADGHIKVMTHRSGHYQTTEHQMVRLITECRSISRAHL